MPSFSAKVELLSRKSKNNPEPIIGSTELHSRKCAKGEIQLERTVVLGGIIGRRTGQPFLNYLEATTFESADPGDCRVEVKLCGPYEEEPIENVVIQAESSVKIYHKKDKTPGENDLDIGLGHTGYRLRVNLNFD